MDPQRFDEMTKTLITGSTSRRRMLRGLLGATGAGALALLGLGGRVGAQEAAEGGAVAATCLKDGKTCKRGNQCCSGVCKRGMCREAPLQGTCTIRKDACKTGGPANGPKCNGVESCECIVTASGASFCREIGGATCSGCQDDRDCVFEIGPGSKCIRKRDRCFQNPCGDIGGDNFCAAPCGFDVESQRRRGVALAPEPAA